MCRAVCILFFPYLDQIVNGLCKKFKYGKFNTNDIRIRNPYIILIGISNFKGYDDLKCVTNDIDKIETILKKNNYNNIKKLVKPNGNVDITHINECLRQAAIKIREINNKKTQSKDSSNEHDEDKNKTSEAIDSLILYYSGHGFENDYTVDSNGNIFSLYKLKHPFNEDDFDALQGKPKFYFFDCCRNMKLPKQAVNKWEKTKGGNISYTSGFASQAATNTLSFYATSDTKYVNEIKNDKHGNNEGKMAHAFANCFETNCIYNQFNSKQRNMNQLLYTLKNQIQQDKRDLLNVVYQYISNCINGYLINYQIKMLLVLDLR